MQLRWTSQRSCQKHSRKSFWKPLRFLYGKLSITTSHKVYLLHSRIEQHLYANCKWVRISNTRVSLIWTSVSQTFLPCWSLQFAQSDILLICDRNLKLLTKRWELFARGGGMFIETNWLRSCIRKINAILVTVFSGIRSKILEGSPFWKVNSSTAAQ